MPTWSNKAKAPSSTTEEYILTPDGYQILVGENEDQILLQQAMLELWGFKSRATSIWSGIQKSINFHFLTFQDGSYKLFQNNSRQYTNSDTITQYQMKQKI